MNPYTKALPSIRANVTISYYILIDTKCKPSTINKVKNHEGQKFNSDLDNLKNDFLNHLQKRLIATDFVFSGNSVSYLINEI